MLAETITGNRLKLESGAEAYEMFTHVHVPDGSLGLQLVIHTDRADAVIRSARNNMLVMVALLIFSWIHAGLIYRYARREERHRLKLSKQENLARMGEMGAMLAHEIRNPLAGIKGFAQLIDRKSGDDRTRESAQRIIIEALRLEDLTTDLLSLARSDEFSVTTVQVADFIEQTVALVQPEVEQTKITIEVDCTHDLEFRGNRDRLTQVLLNIVKNGFQAMPDGGFLYITARQSDSYIAIMIADSGKGIDPDDLQKVFEPFFTTKARGTGLGLALCKKIIEEHNGTIDIESSSTGTIVTMMLPVEWRKDEK
jgi:two-component system sensor histidine kinase HydH